MDELQVTTDKGDVRGKLCRYEATTYYSFQGIPYAEPPLGRLRFKAPVPKTRWNGVRDCTKEGTICYSREFWTKQAQGSEDCLTLNVYTPKLPSKDQELNPVMIFIHGGAFIEGSSQKDVYGPDFLLPHHVLLITFNYRINCLGFLSLADPSLEVPGNCGIRDAILVLKWVQGNVKNFGGDPTNVTIFGHSAGAAIAHLLTLTSVAEGLYHKVILQSGTALNFWCMKIKRYAKSLAANLGFEDENEASILNFLQQQSVEALMKAQRKLPNAYPIGPIVETVHESALWTKHPLELLKEGQFTKVPMIIGWASQEGFLANVILRDKNGGLKIYTNFEEFALTNLLVCSNNRNLKTIAALIKDFYYGEEEPSMENLHIFYTMISDAWYLKDIFKTIEYHVAVSPHPVYTYRFSACTTLNLYKKLLNIEHFSGCSHGDELGYLFAHAQTPEIRARSVEHACQQCLIGLWTNFARYGHPTPLHQKGFHGVTWEPTGLKQFRYLDIGLKLKMGSELKVETRTFWRKIDQLIEEGKPV